MEGKGRGKRKGEVRGREEKERGRERGGRRKDQLCPYLSTLATLVIFVSELFNFLIVNHPNNNNNSNSMLGCTCSQTQQINEPTRCIVTWRFECKSASHGNGSFIKSAILQFVGRHTRRTIYCRLVSSEFSAENFRKFDKDFVSLYTF